MDKPGNKSKIFQDIRHAKRLRKTLLLLSEHPGETVPKASGNANKSQSIYRFWSNEKVKKTQILASHREGVVRRCVEAGVVLAIQDTTDLEYTTHEATKDLGYINQTPQQGIKVHSCIAVSSKGEPLGMLHQQSWTRKQRSGKKKERKKKPIQEKESYRWLQTAKGAEEGLAEKIQLIHVADREADIFELFAQKRSANSELLIRGEYNRRVKEEMGYLLPMIEQGSILGTMTINLERNPKRRARQATLQIRGMRVTLEVPQNHPKPHNLHPVEINVLLVEETEKPADGSQPIRWLLLTTLPIDDFQQAWQCVRWYSYRWLIERFHFTLKSGCGVEKLQLQTRERLLKALATYNIVAWRLMWLTYQARLNPNASCQVVFSPAEWKLLRRKFQPKNRSKKPPTLHQALMSDCALGWIFGS
ncbi:IS4 family transposase [Moorena bouillonii]|uniref:IS4 family transposase n=1 Tax=Moorena bouillonii TaxID=207920 RepID=UPI000A6A10AD|nr:IS4 family transposase [Moorena bouillonii]